jgi:hypothetical protein
MPPVAEKRVESRFLILDCNVRLEPKGILDRFGNQMHCASTINLSPSGIQVISYDILKTQKQYDIAIYTRVFRQPISTKGRIVWRKPYDGKDSKRYYRTGFEFTYFKEYAMEQLEALKISPHLH